MKTYYDKLKETPIEILRDWIKRQEAEVEIAKRDLQKMKDVLAERTNPNLK